MRINDYCRNNRQGRSNLVRPIRCKDGFVMSVQASPYHYSTPTGWDPEEYTHFEVGYPSQPEELLGAEDEGVYAYIPAEIIDRVIEKHGGLID